MEREVGGMEMGTAFFLVRVREEPQGFKKMVSALIKKADSTQRFIKKL